MFQMKGAGLPNVRLVSGYALEGEGEDRSVAFRDIDGLYQAISRAVACRGADLTPAEFRFLRRRLGKSQEEVGNLVGTTDQAVAKWEKGVTPVPTGSARLLRLAWLAEHAPEHLPRALEKMWSIREFYCHGYVFAFSADEKWVDISDQYEFKPIKAEAERLTSAVVSGLAVRAQSTKYTTQTNFGSKVIA